MMRRLLVLFVAMLGLAACAIDGETVRHVYPQEMAGTDRHDPRPDPDAEEPRLLGDGGWRVIRDRAVSIRPEPAEVDIAPPAEPAPDEPDVIDETPGNI